MQNRECIVFEGTRDTEQRIHEPCACLWVPCSSCLQLIIGCIYLHLTCMAAHLTAGIFYRLPLRKVITPQNFLRLWRKIIQKASLAHHKFFSFKKRPNISLYDECLPTLIWFFEDSKFVYKATKLYTKCNLRQKHELQYLKYFSM